MQSNLAQYRSKAYQYLQEFQEKANSISTEGNIQRLNQQLNSSKSAKTLHGDLDFMPFQNERNHLGQLITEKQHQRTPSNLKTDLAHLRLVSSVLPNQAKKLISRGNIHFFEKGALRVQFASRPSENSLLYDPEAATELPPQHQS